MASVQVPPGFSEFSLATKFAAEYLCFFECEQNAKACTYNSHLQSGFEEQD
jgi:hypothetical protein